MKQKIIALICVAVSFVSCENLKQAYSDIAELQERVDDIEFQLKALQAAYDSGKIIKEVEFYEDELNTGWTITFSDNEAITIYDGLNGKDGEDGKDGVDGENGEDGITPIVTINTEGYWEVSYDNGETFSLIVDNEGKPIQSKGNDGAEGQSIRVVIADDGKYVIECYYSSYPETVLESLVTPISSDPSTCISSIIKDPYNGTITLVMADGTEYVFNLDVTYPTSIVILAENIVMPKNGTSVLTFRVNPSNAVVDLNLTHENPMFELDRAIENMTRSYVTASENYVLESIEAATDGDGNVKQGQYIATIKDVGNSSDYCEGAVLVLNTKDGKKNDIQVSSDLFKIKTPDKPQFTTFSIEGSYAMRLEDDMISIQLPYGTDVTSLRPYFVVSEGTVTIDGVEVKPYAATDFSSPVEYTITTDDGKVENYYISISYSNIPVVYINTKDAAPIVSKEDWLKGTDIFITNAGKNNDHYSEAQIRGRGNSTWECPKKPYAIKLDSKEEVLGMPKHKRWVLLANYFDKTCLRNSIAFEIARRSPGLEWTPRGQHVDVVINGEFLGNYYLCEHIKGDKNRVPITEMESTDIDEETITGGYLLELDKHFDEVNKFYSPVRNRPVMIKEPDVDVLTSEQFTYIQNHIAEIENALYWEGSTTEGYLNYIDLDSFIDYWLVYELTSTGEPTHPKSVYMYKDRGGKMHAGPVWDFDYFTYQSYYNTMLINTQAVWNDRIIHDPNNQEYIRQRWNNARTDYENIADEILRQWSLIKESAEYNAVIWSPLYRDPNKEANMSVEEAVNNIWSFYTTHFGYMDSLYKYQ